MKTVISRVMNYLSVCFYSSHTYKHILKCIILFSCQNGNYTSHGFPGRPGIVTQLALLSVTFVLFIAFNIFPIFICNKFKLF